MGMSNVGKSFRAREMAKFDKFFQVSVDDLIAEGMQLKNMSALANWMGYPYEENFEEHVKEYLQHEKKFTTNIDLSLNKNIVLDTTGSVVYLPSEAQEFVKNNFLVINLELPAAMKDKMIDHFFAHPKPVVWGESFDLQEGEDKKEALRRCYPDLLAWREEKYREMADVSVNFFEDTSWVGYREFWRRLEGSLSEEA